MSERARTDSHGVTHAERARRRAEIQRFFESYRHAFNRLDAGDVARHFCVPSMMSTNDGYTVWTDTSQVLNNMVALCDLYRTHGVAQAHWELRAVVDPPRAQAFANVLWTIDRQESLPPWRFRTSYNLRQGAGRWCILLCTAYEEQSPDAYRRG